jgi:hypothetical protein
MASPRRQAAASLTEKCGGLPPEKRVVFKMSLPFCAWLSQLRVILKSEVEMEQGRGIPLVVSPSTGCRQSHRKVWWTSPGKAGC